MNNNSYLFYTVSPVSDNNRRLAIDTENNSYYMVDDNLNHGSKLTICFDTEFDAENFITDFFSKNKYFQKMKPSKVYVTKDDIKYCKVM